MFVRKEKGKKTVERIKNVNLIFWDKKAKVVQMLWTLGKREIIKKISFYLYFHNASLFVYNFIIFKQKDVILF